MGKWLVVYSSVTGNTKKVAEAMAQAAKEADLFSVDEVPEDLSGYEVVLAGYWLRRGGPDPKMARFLPRVAGRQVVFFQTHGTMPGTEHAVTAFARAALLLGEGCSILGTFSCQGKINPVLIKKRKKAGPEDPHANSAENAAAGRQRPIILTPGICRQRRILSRGCTGSCCCGQGSRRNRAGPGKQQFHNFFTFRL